jgi:hypothetical protein
LSADMPVKAYLRRDLRLFFEIFEAYKGGPKLGTCAAGSASLAGPVVPAGSAGSAGSAGPGPALMDAFASPRKVNQFHGAELVAWTPPTKASAAMSPPVCSASPVLPNAIKVRLAFPHPPGDLSSGVGHNLANRAPKSLGRVHSH